MNFPVYGYNECLIMYILAAASPTHSIPAEVYHDGWAEQGAIVDPHKVEDIELHLRYQGCEALSIAPIVSVTPSNGRVLDLTVGD